jgi:hypothetical protein
MRVDSPAASKIADAGAEEDFDILERSPRRVARFAMSRLSRGVPRE